MNEPHDPDRTVDEFSSESPDPLDAGLAAGFGPPRSSLGAAPRRVLLVEAERDHDHIVKPNTDAMPNRAEVGDRYQLLGEIARGGMGAVLRGRDVDLGRDLAVKVLLEKHAHRPEVVQRFLEEAQIAGQLQHPGVVPVYDIGRFGERPFFTMKLVKGKTLAGLLGERSDPAADLPRFLADFLKVAQAMAYAHAHGVIHRDLKPSNVMVGRFGEVQVMDWGLAKVLAEGGVADEERASRLHQEEAESLIRTARSSGSASSFGTQTEAGSLLGTPAYMPPEQANGDVANLDRRADVFGLGALLCEILTGKPPYVGRSPEEVRRKSANGDLLDALARLDACGADEELIALTKSCLAPEASDRPRDAQAVADSLTEYLDGVQRRLHQTELARAEANARAIEETKRRKLTLALAATVLLAAALGGGWWAYVRSERETRRVQVTREVNEALESALSLRSQARMAGGEAQFAQAREQAQRALALVESGPADPALAERVRALQAELDEEDKERKLIEALDEARSAPADFDFAGTRFVFGRVVPRFREAFRAFSMPPGEGDPAEVAGRIRRRPPAVRDAIVAALDEWIELTAVPGPDAREPELAWVRAVLSAAEPEDGWTRRFRAAREEKQWVRKRAALLSLADEAEKDSLSVQSVTRLARRLPPVRRVPLLRRACRQNPGDFWVNYYLGDALLELSPTRFDESIRYLAIAVALRPASSAVHTSLGIALARDSRFDEAIDTFSKASDLAPTSGHCHYNLGNALWHKDRRVEAIACYRKAIALEPEFAGAHNNLGKALETEGKLDEAIASYRKSIALDPRDVTAYHNLGKALKKKGDLDAAIASFRKAISLDPKCDAAVYNSLGIALVKKGQIDEAIVAYQKAIALDSRQPLIHGNLGTQLQNKGRLDDAITSYRKAIELDQKNPKYHVSLGTVLAMKGKVDEAIERFREAIALDPKFAEAHNNLGTALTGQGQKDAGFACFRKAIECDPQLAKAHNNLGFALMLEGQLDGAIAALFKAVGLDPGDAQAHLNFSGALLQKLRFAEAIVICRATLEIDPLYAEAHCNLGQALSGLGRFGEALTAFRRGHELGRKKVGWAYPSAKWVRDAERLAAVEAKLTEYLAGTRKPRSGSERLDLLLVCRSKKLFAATAHLSADAFAADPALALAAGHRYNAACDAALASEGEGGDAGNLSSMQRLALRRQALTWLRADLAGWSRQLRAGEVGRSRLARTLKHWQNDRDLAGLRNEADLAKLSEQERKAFAAFWADVRSLLDAAESKSK